MSCYTLKMRNYILYYRFSNFNLFFYHLDLNIFPAEFTCVTLTASKIFSLTISRELAWLKICASHSGILLLLLFLVIILLQNNICLNCPLRCSSARSAMLYEVNESLHSKGFPLYLDCICFYLQSRIDLAL